MYGSYMSAASKSRDLDRERSNVELLSKVNSLERSQEKLFQVVENQGHELRALITTVLNEIRQNHDIISLQSREVSHFLHEMRGEKMSNKPHGDHGDISRVPEQNQGNKVVESHLEGIHEGVNSIVSYMKDMATKSSINTISKQKSEIAGPSTTKSDVLTAENDNKQSPARLNTAVTTLTSGFGNAFKPKAGSWECNCCFTRNNEEVLECLACCALKNGQQSKVKEPQNKETNKPAVTIINEELSINGLGLKMNTKEDAEILVDPISLAMKEKDAGKMKILTLSGNSIGIEAAKAIGGALEFRPELKRANWNNMFTGRMKTEIPDALRHLSYGLIKAKVQLVELDLSDNAFGPIGVEGISDLLKSSTCSTLKELKLNNTGLGVTGGKYLAKTLLDAYDESLKKKISPSFGLKVFVLGRSRQENEGAIALAEVFKKMGTLEKVVMPQNGIYQEGIAALADAFKNNPNLRYLDLSDNTITAKGAKPLASALANLRKLEYLNLGDCLLQTSGAQFIADGLQQSGSESLRELYMDSNEIRSDGGLKIVNAIKNCITIEYLMLDGNNFGEQGCRKISEVLENHKKEYIMREIQDDCGSEYDSDEQNCLEETVSETKVASIIQKKEESNSIEVCLPSNKNAAVSNNATAPDTNELQPTAVSKSIFSMGKSLFGGSSDKSSSSNSIFGGEKTDSANVPEKPIFGSSIFGGSIYKDSSSTSIFGGDKTDTANAPETSIFGGSNTTSFASLSLQNSKPLFGQKVEGFTFAGAGKSLFNSSIKTEPEDKQDETEDQVEENEHDPHFEPIIPLPELIEVQTGEEDEQEIFKYRAKVFRYDNDIKQWKERGVGDIKILKHPGRLTYRILLRRDQTLKVACNHLISEQMELKPLSTSETALWWSAVDYADEEPKTEALAVKFKTVDTRNDFKRVFEDAQKEIKASKLQ